MYLRLTSSVLFLLAVVVAPLGAIEPPGWKMLYSEDFVVKATADWHLNKGTWKTVDEAWQGAEVPDEKHGAVARLDLAFTDAVVEFDVKFDGARMAQLSMNDAKAHLCRVQILPTGFRVMKDDHDGKTGPDKGEVLADKKVDLKSGEWHHVRVEMQGSEMTAKIDDVSGSGKSDQVAMRKTNLAFVVSGQTASFRNLRVYVPAK